MLRSKRSFKHDERRTRKYAGQHISVVGPSPIVSTNYFFPARTLLEMSVLLSQADVGRNVRHRNNHAPLRDLNQNATGALQGRNNDDLT